MDKKAKKASKASRDMLPIFLKKDITRKVKMLDQA